VDLIGLLKNLMGGPKPAAPSEQIPASIRRPAEQQDAPAADPFRLRDAPTTQWAPPAWSAPAPQPQQQQQEGPWRQINFSPPPANTPPAPSLAAPLPDGFSVTSGQAQAAKQVEEKQAAEKQNNWFGGEDKYTTKEMSVDQYLTLTPQQRAAIDANTALVQAAEQDTASWAKEQVSGKPISDKNYQDQVKKSFGDNGGSETYAPRTLAVLNDLGLNTQGKDLDQYLNYSALVTDQDLQGLAGTPAGDNPRQQNAAAIAKAASNRLSETLASGQTLLDSIRTSSDQNKQLFGEPSTKDPIGFTNSARDADLKQAFDILAQTRSQQDLTPETVSALYAELQQKYGVTPNEVAQYFDTRLQSKEYLGATGDQPVSLGGPGTNLEYLSPQDFRSKFLTRGE